MRKKLLDLEHALRTFGPSPGPGELWSGGDSSVINPGEPGMTEARRAFVGSYLVTAAVVLVWGFGGR